MRKPSTRQIIAGVTLFVVAVGLIVFAAGTYSDENDTTSTAAPAWEPSAIVQTLQHNGYSISGKQVWMPEGDSAWLTGTTLESPGRADVLVVDDTINAFVAQDGQDRCVVPANPNLKEVLAAGDKAIASQAQGSWPLATPREDGLVNGVSVATGNADSSATCYDYAAL